jgi:hypothetical protein
MKHFKTFICVLALLAAFSCTKNQVDDCGHVSFSVANDPEVELVTKSNVSDFTTLPSAGEFTITIKKEDGTSVYSGLLSDWDSATPLLVGKYTVEAVYGSVEEEGFDNPCFIGTQEFTVVGGETASVSVSVALANTIIKISCSEIFRTYYTDYTFKLTRDNVDIVTFTKNETRAAFIDGYKIKVEGTLTNEIKTQTFSKEYTRLDESKAYTLAFDVTNVGGSTITISFNEEVDEEPLGELELND